MKSQNLLKGQVLEQLISTLFKRAKYKVIPLGVEHQFPDIDALTVEEYREQLPKGLRLLPDLMVYRWETGKPKIFFIEIKFRTELTEYSLCKLREGLERQYQQWSDTFCILALAKPPISYREDKYYHQRYLKVIDLRDLSRYPSTPQQFWQEAKNITQVFPEFTSNWSKNPLTQEVNLDYAATLEPLLDDSVRIIRSLGDIKSRE